MRIVSHHTGQHGTVCIDLRRPGLAELYLLVEYGSDVHVSASNSCVTALRAFSTWLPRLSDLLDRLGLGVRSGWQDGLERSSPSNGGWIVASSAWIQHLTFSGRACDALRAHFVVSMAWVKNEILELEDESYTVGKDFSNAFQWYRLNSFGPKPRATRAPEA